MTAMPKPLDLPPEGKNKLGDKISIPISSMKSRTMESITPIHLSNINTDPVWTFVLKTRAEEFVRFYPESLSMVLFGTYANPEHEARHAEPIRAAENHALMARSDLPPMFLLPTVMGTGFIQRVEVLMNGVRVGTNEAVGTHLQHYVHAAKIFNKKPTTPYLATNRDLQSTGRNDKTEAMTEASKPFDYNTWNAETGTRISAYLDGVYPFDTRNKTRATIISEDAEAMYLPPETEFTFKFFLNQSRRQSIFHLTGCTMAEYFENDTDGRAAAYNLTFQTVELSYESVQLKPSEHMSIMSKLSKTVLTFPYDIPKVSYQVLQGNATFTENVFQIQGNASILYVMFLKSWQVHFTPNRMKPTSPLSQFPEHCTTMKMSFANEPHLVLKKMNNFGQRPTVSQDISIYNYFKYLRERNIFQGNFDTLFPSTADTTSYVQVLVADLSSLSSKRTDLLKIQCYFTGANRSPQDVMIFVTTVHPTGLATCTNSSFWEFKELEN